VRVEGGAVKVLTLDRPERRNTIDEELHRDLLDALHEATAHRETRAIVLTGSGSCFSAGGDFDLIRALRTDVRLRREILGRGRDVFHRLTTMAIPVVAAVNGPAVGAGCTLALLCDIVVMADDAHLADPHVAVGLVPGDGGTVLWPLVAGLSAARAYLLTGDRLPAAEAHRLGLVHRIVPRADVLAVATELAGRIAALPAQAVQETKRCLDAHVARAAGLVFEQALEAEDRSFDTDEHARAIDAMAAVDRRRGGGERA
jgi:enoyl-CoA hydratase